MRQMSVSHRRVIYDHYINVLSMSAVIIGLPDTESLDSLTHLRDDRDASGIP